MYVICAGMNRAGSTWQYNVVSTLVEGHHGGRRLGFFRSGDAFADLLSTATSTWLALKTHDRHPAFAKALAAGQALAVHSYRDLRDVAYSLMHKCSADFDQVVLHQRCLHTCLDNDRFWRVQPRTLSQRYEDILADPAAAVRQLADHLSISLTEKQAKALAAEYSLEANRCRANALAERLRQEGVCLDDPANALRHEEHTQLHWNHIRDGRPGGWRGRASPRERALLAAICGDWLIERGYEADYLWAQPALPELCRLLGQQYRRPVEPQGFGWLRRLFSAWRRRDQSPPAAHPRADKSAAPPSDRPVASPR
jgi:LPS sulfotransferase NodH